MENLRIHLLISIQLYIEHNTNVLLRYTIVSAIVGYGNLRTAITTIISTLTERNPHQVIHVISGKVQIISSEHTPGFVTPLRGDHHQHQDPCYTYPNTEFYGSGAGVLPGKLDLLVNKHTLYSYVVLGGYTCQGNQDPIRIRLSF